jgi:excinuclease ABC subunit A
VWEELYEMLQEAAPDGQFLWNNKVLVHLYLPEQREPWATVITKRAQSLDLALTGPKGCVTLGRLTGLGRDRELDATRASADIVKLRFRTVEDLHKGDVMALLQEHKAAVLDNGQATA